MPYGNTKVAVACFALGVALLHPSLAAPAKAQIPRSATPVVTTLGSPTQSLMESANYWRSRGDPTAAQHALERVLSYRPNDTDVLAMAAEVAFQANDYDAAARYRTRLTQVAPSDPRLQTLAAERRLEPEDEALLVQARRLAQDGKSAEAVAKYRQLFAGRVIPGLAVEYYSLLALTPGGFDEANRELSAMVERSPQDPQLQLAYARFLVLQDETRDDGIKRLAILAKRPGIEMAASHIWREALLWQGPNEKSRNQLDAYLREYPGDKAIEAKSREYTAMLPDGSTKAVMRGYYAMSVNEMGKAEQEFTDAYKLNPRNPNAAFMLAMFRRSHGREAEARSLIAQAIAAAPERREEFTEASGGAAGAWLSPEAEQRVEVSLLNATGRYDEAEQLLARISVGHETASTYTQLGEIQTRAGRLDDAETSFQKARSLSPRGGDAVCGQANVMLRRGRLEEAAALYTEAAALYGRNNNPGGMWRVWTGRAGLMRARVSSLDAAQAARLYEASLATDPRNMPMRLDEGRLLRQIGRDAQAWSVVAKGVDLNPGNRAAMQLAMNFADQGGDREHAAQLARQLDQTGRAPTVQFASRKSPAASRAGRLQPVAAVQP